MTTTTAPIEIVCPPWCTESMEEHIADSRGQWTTIAHMRRYGTEHTDLWLQVVTWPDGSPGPQQGTPELAAYADGDSNGLSLHEAEQLAATLLAAIKEARA